MGKFLAKPKISIFLDDDPRGLERGIFLARENAWADLLNIYLDPAVEWIDIVSYQDFVAFIEEDFFEIERISFDNDLGLEKDGIDCARFLVKYCLDNDLALPKCSVHSQNSVASKEIYRSLNDYYKFKSFTS